MTQSGSYKRSGCVVSGITLCLFAFWLSFRLIVYPAMYGDETNFGKYLTIMLALVPVTLFFGSMMTGCFIAPHIDRTIKSIVIAAPGLYIVPVVFVLAARSTLFDSWFFILCVCLGLIALLMLSVAGVAVGVRLKSVKNKKTLTDTMEVSGQT